MKSSKKKKTKKQKTLSFQPSAPSLPETVHSPSSTPQRQTCLFFQRLSLRFVIQSMLFYSELPMAMAMVSPKPQKQCYPEFLLLLFPNYKDKTQALGICSELPKVPQLDDRGSDPRAGSLTGQGPESRSAQCPLCVCHSLLPSFSFHSVITSKSSPNSSVAQFESQVGGP